MLMPVRRAVRERLLRVVDQAVAARVGVLEVEAAERHAEVMGTLAALEHRRRRDLGTALDAEAAATSAALVRSAMDRAVPHGHPHATLRHALSEVSVGGMFLEFGVASGTTLKIITEHADGAAVFGFDSFEGLPEHWRLGFGPGMFAQQEPPDVPAEVVVGLFQDTLPGFLQEHPGPVTFLHCDADLYSSTRTILDLVGPRLVPGSVVVFDEFFNYPRWQDHEFRAWEEWLDSTGVEVEYLGFTWDHEQVSARVVGTPWATVTQAEAPPPLP